jgi:hypothetical protein
MVLQSLVETFDYYIYIYGSQLTIHLVLFCSTFPKSGFAIHLLYIKSVSRGFTGGLPPIYLCVIQLARQLGLNSRSAHFAMGDGLSAIRASQERLGSRRREFTNA